MMAAIPLAAQSDDYLRRSHIVFSGGAMNYIGDLNNQSALAMPDPAFSFGLHTAFDNRWAMLMAMCTAAIISNVAISVSAR